MPIRDLLLPEFDEEMKKTRATLERVPVDKPDFAPHPKSMPLGKLAPHVAQLAGFGMTILTAPGLDFAQGSYRPPQPQSAAELVKFFDEGAAKVRSALAAMPDEAWKQNWKLLLAGKTIFGALEPTRLSNPPAGRQFEKGTPGNCYHLPPAATFWCGFSACGG